MPAWLRKTLITITSAFSVVFIYMFFDPSLRDFLYAIILSIYLTVLKTIVKFVFKKGVMSVATIAWNRIFFVGGAALFKRFWINFFKKNTVEHVVNPLMPSAKKWLIVHLAVFKNQPRWLQLSETTVGVVVIGAFGYLFGAIASVWTIIQKFLTGTFQNFFLSVLGMITGAFKYVWSKIQPWLDVIIITAFIDMVEKMPGVKSLFRNTKKVKDKVVEQKDKAIHAVVHKPVKSMCNIIEKHADDKIKKQQNVTMG